MSTHGPASCQRRPAGFSSVPAPPDEAHVVREGAIGGGERADGGREVVVEGGPLVAEDRGREERGGSDLPAETVTVPDRRAVERTIDDVVANVFSSSSTAPHLFGDRQEDFEHDMRKILAQASPSGRFSIRLPDNILRIWRLPA